MLGRDSKEGFSELLPGVRIKTLVHGENTLMTKFLLTRGSALPRHRHPFEQTGFLVSGRIRLTIGDAAYEVGVGDSWCVGPDVEHLAEILEDSVALEIFAPARPDYLRYLGESEET